MAIIHRWRAKYCLCTAISIQCPFFSLHTLWVIHQYKFWNCVQVGKTWIMDYGLFAKLIMKLVGPWARLRSSTSNERNIVCLVKGIHKKSDNYTNYANYWGWYFQKHTLFSQTLKLPRLKKIYYKIMDKCSFIIDSRKLVLLLRFCRVIIFSYENTWLSMNSAKCQYIQWIKIPWLVFLMNNVEMNNAS